MRYCRNGRVGFLKRDRKGHHSFARHSFGSFVQREASCHDSSSFSTKLTCMARKLMLVTAILEADLPVPAELLEDYTPANFLTAIPRDTLGKNYPNEPFSNARPTKTM